MRFLVANSFKHVFVYLDVMEECKGRYIAFVSDWLTQKGLQKLSSEEGPQRHFSCVIRFCHTIE